MSPAKTFGLLTASLILGACHDGTSPPPIPTAPAGLTASVVGATRVELGWQDQSGNETSFAIERETGGTWGQIAQTPSNDAAFTDTTVTAGSTYSYRIRACNGKRCSDPSNEVSVGTAASLKFTEQPSDVAAPDDVFAAGFPIYPYVAVEVLDASGQPLTDYQQPIALSFAKDPSGGTLKGGQSVAPSKGVAIFPGLKIDKAGSGYALAASTTGLGDAASDSFSVTLPGDLNLDGWADEFDLAQLNAHLGATDYPPADINKDGVVDTVDLDILSSHFTPSLDVQDASAVTASGATLGASVRSTDGVVAWFDWGTDPQLATYDSTSTMNVAAGTTPVTATIGPLAADTTYYFRIAARRGSYVAHSEATDSFTVPPSGPAAPSSLTVTSFSDSTVTLGWQDNSSNETRFEIERELAGSGSWSNLGQVGAGVTSFSDTTVAPSTSYTYRVRACNADGCSAYSNKASVTTAAAVAWKQLSAAGTHTCGVTDNGTAYCWGSNNRGELGNGTMTYSDTPQPVSGSLAASEISAGGLGTGDEHTCALTEAGTVLCWGRNNFGQLGDSTTNDHDVPTPIRSSEQFSLVSAGGGYQTCAVTTGQAAYCWGSEAFGQLGNGVSAIAAMPIPTAVQQPSNAASIGAGGFFTCGVFAGGAGYCWGFNQDGELGSSPSNTSTPQAVSGGHVFQTISAGGEHACGLEAGGDIYCWGSNTQGQLGNGTTTGGPTPVKVVASTSFVAVAANYLHTCAIATGGAVYCWGGNAHGELGDGNTTMETTPVLVSLPNAAVSITAGAEYTCAVTETGVAYCWGANSDGQLGIGSTADSADPARVVAPAGK